MIFGEKRLSRNKVLKATVRGFNGFIGPFASGIHICALPHFFVSKGYRRRLKHRLKPVLFVHVEIRSEKRYVWALETPRMQAG